MSPWEGQALGGGGALLTTAHETPAWLLDLKDKERHGM